MAQRFPFDDQSPARRIASDVIGRAGEDTVFAIRFIGTSQELMHSHFRAFIEDALARAGVQAADHPMLSLFIDAHARELREFVFTGVAAARPFRLPEIETLTGDAETLLRVDIWDALAGHVETAQRQFLSGIDRTVAALRAAEDGVQRREDPR